MLETILAFNEEHSTGYEVHCINLFVYYHLLGNNLLIYDFLRDCRQVLLLLLHKFNLIN